MEECSGEDVHAVQTDYQDLAKAATASAAAPQIWDVLVRFRPVLDQSTALGPISRCREMMW